MSFKNPIIVGEELIPGGLRSNDYVESETGWRIDKNGGAQFDNLQVLKALGVGDISADTLDLNGIGNLADALDIMPKGIVAYGANASGTNAGNTSGANELKMFEYSFGPVYPGRLYKTTIVFSWAGSVTDDCYDFLCRNTVDGTTPGLSSAIFPGSFWRAMQPRVTPIPTTIVFYWFPGGNYELARFCLTMKRSNGTGYGWITLTDPNRRMSWTVEDMGLQSTALANTALSQKVTGGGSVPDPAPPPPEPDPIVSYTKSWLATWSRSFDEDDNTRQGDDTNDMYQGYYSSTHGRTFSLAGFDYSSIMSNLAGATIKSCKLTYKVKWIAGYSGLNVRVNGHDYTSKPGSVDQARVDENIIGLSADRAAGSSYTVDLGTTIGGKFKSGVFKGIGFGPAGSQNEYGRMYGETSTSRPKLTITYEK